MPRVLSLLANVIFATVLSAGCDAVAFVKQDVTLNATDAETGKRIGNATVVALFDNTSGDCPTASDFEQAVESSTCACGETDEDGAVTLTLTQANICGVLAIRPFCKLDGDAVTGLPYCIQVTRDRNSEILRLELAPSAVVDGSAFTIQVQSIGEPIPVDQTESALD